MIGKRHTGEMSLLRVASPTLAVLAITHAAVDATCAVVLWQAVHDGVIAGSSAWGFFVLYNLLAFACQPVVGLVVDHARVPFGTAVIGAFTTVLAVPLAAVPRLFPAALAAAGVGNALYHVGAGTVSLRLAPGKALPVGLFVAPGAAGLLLGIEIGKAGGPAWPFALALAALALAVQASPRTVISKTRTRADSTPVADRLAAMIFLLLFVIGVRSYVGLALIFPWKSRPWLLILFTAAVVAGKALGGALADRFGWRLIGVGALVLSAPFLVYGSGSSAVGILGILIFNMTMPITLVALAETMPGHEGFAFGLCCLALFVGSAPVLLGWTSGLDTGMLLATIALAAVALWLGLRSPTAAPSPRKHKVSQSVTEGSY